MKFPKFTTYQIVLEILSLIVTLGLTVYMLLTYVTSWRAWMLFALVWLTYLLLTVFSCIPRFLEEPNAPWPLDPMHKAEIAGITLAFFCEGKLLCTALLAYSCLAIRVYAVPLAPLWLLIALVIICAARRIKQLSKFKKT